MNAARKLRPLLKRADFVAASKSPYRFFGKTLILQKNPREAVEEMGTGPRFGFTATAAKIGNAVLRNRAKRRLRAIAREVFATIADDNADYVFIATPQTIVATMPDLLAEAQKAISFLQKPPRPDRRI